MHRVNILPRRQLVRAQKTVGFRQIMQKNTVMSSAQTGNGFDSWLIMTPTPSALPARLMAGLGDGTEYRKIV
jgi:hypothetical protein